MSFHNEISVYFEDCDQTGVVYHANYVKFLERARTDFFLSKGVSLLKLQEEGTQFVIADLSLKFLKPARLHDRLMVFSELVSIKGAKLTFDQKIILKHDMSEELCRAKVLVGCVGPTLKPTRVPQQLRKELESERGFNGH